MRRSSKRVWNRKALVLKWNQTISLLVTASLMLTFGAWAQSPCEVLLTADNAYNPIPSPDGRYVAYVRTGWGEKAWTGFGRASLVSEVRLVNAEGVPAPKVLAEDFFLSGWTPGSMRVVCYRDWKYALVSKEGKQKLKGQIPNDPNHFDVGAEWVGYAVGEVFSLDFPFYRTTWIEFTAA